MPKYLTRSLRVAVAAALLSAAGLTSSALANETVVDRSAFSTTVKAGDAFKTRTYPEQINFKDDDGDWLAIDRSLESKSDGSVRPVAIDGDAVIPSTLTKPVVLKHDGRSVSFRLLGADADAERDVSGSKASFDDALTGVDVSYKSRPNGLKELIELGSRSSRRSFSYDVRADSDLTAAIVAGDLVFEDAAGTERFRVAAPLAWDSAALAETSDALTLSVSKTADRQWRLTMRADDQWLDDPARVYPVTLDPDYFWIDGYMRFHGANQDCALAGNDLANQNRCAYTALQIGYGNNRPYKSVMKFDVAAAIPTYARVTASRFLAWQFPSSSKLEQTSRLRTVTSSWDNTATWNKRVGTTSWTTAGGDVSTNAALTGAPITIGASGYWSYWPAPLAAVSGWIKGTVPNYGFQISTDATTPTVKSAYEFTSTDGAQNLWPALEVTWVPDATAPTPSTVAGPASGDGTYLGGAATGTITATATDENSGIRQLDLLRDGNEIAVHGISCPDNTCALTTTDSFAYNTTTWTEGAHTLQVRAYDDAGNESLSAPWTVYVDRSAPVIDEAAQATRDGSDISVTWGSDDAQLADGSPGSEVLTDSVRLFRNGAWTAWTDTTEQSAWWTGPETSVTLQLKSRDRVGNEQTFAQSTVTVGQPEGIPFDATDLDDPTIATPGDCVDVYGAAECGEDTSSASLFAAAAASASNPSYGSVTSWGLADPNRGYNANQVDNSFIANADAQALANHVRLLVPWNIYKWSDRLKRLGRELRAIRAAGLYAMVSIEAGCNKDDIRTSCSGTSMMMSNTAPKPVDVRKAVIEMLKKVEDQNGVKRGTAVKWIGVWNEPTGGKQPFREGGVKGGGLAGLQNLTAELTGSNGPCTGSRNFKCKVVSAEIEIGRTYYKRYATFLRTSNRVVRSRIGYYGAHDYPEVFAARNSTVKKATDSKLASWMAVLPSGAQVWLPEIAVFRRTAPSEAHPAGEETNVEQRRNQARYLFNKLSKLDVPANNSRVARASYYMFCPAESTNWDSSLYGDDNSPSGTDCTSGTGNNGQTNSKRQEILDFFEPVAG